MGRALRYVFLVLTLLMGLHFILSFSHEDYGRATSLSRWRKPLPYKTIPRPDSVIYDPVTNTNKTRKANAAFVVLARNLDLNGVLGSMKQMEDRFNKRFDYPWVFLNEEPFSDEFKQRTTEVTSSKTSYGLIPRNHWVQPSWIDETKAVKSRQAMLNAKVIYGGSVAYRNMCRFNSGFFFRHELLKDIRYYWRVEPNVQYFCDLDYDPFLLMQDNNKVYGYTISLLEYQATIPSLWQSTKEFIQEHPEYLVDGNAMKFISDDGGETYNRCHFWSNFEIGDLDFWRGEAYMKYFEHLDLKGGFYYERWGDAPIHSIALAMFATKDQIHLFDDIGYQHTPFTHCPSGEAHARGKCWCDVKETFDHQWYSCRDKYEALYS